MFTAWQTIFIGLSVILTSATARRPPHEQVTALDFESGEPSVSIQPTTTTSVGPIDGVHALILKTTSSPAVASTVQTPHVNSFAQTPHDQISATGFEATSTPLPQEPGCFHTQTQLISNQYTTTAVIPCGANSPGSFTAINTGDKGPFSNIPHSQTTVAGNDPGSILHASSAPIRGGGHGPLPEPETTVPGNDMSSILGGPGAGPPEETPIQNAPKNAPPKTVGEPGPITATPAASPEPAPVQTPIQEPLPSQATGQPITIPAQPAPTIVKSPPVITIGSLSITADSSSRFIVGTQTLAPGGPAITHSGTVLSIPSLGSGVVIGPSTQAIQLVDAGKTHDLTPSLPVITVGGTKITGNSASQYIIDGQTLAAGQSPITVSGQVLSISSSGNAVVFGPSTQAFATPPSILLTNPPALTVGGSIITANSASDYVIKGQILHPGGSAITIGGKIISVAPSATALVIGGSTQALTPSPVLVTALPPLITFGSQILHANAASEYVVGGQTLKPGQSITVSGTVISLAPGASDVVIGASTEALTPQLVSITTGLPVLTVGSRASMFFPAKRSDLERMQ
ncbi:MAG: hypothetical protein L6R40_003102 [Gallowayella cf. fulva]|nr:MAG: hypothetical protein L6R40_003102 [Xanthomendoza cf. fulva]